MFSTWYHIAVDLQVLNMVRNQHISPYGCGIVAMNINYCRKKRYSITFQIYINVFIGSKQSTVWIKNVYKLL